MEATAIAVDVKFASAPTKIVSPEKHEFAAVVNVAKLCAGALYVGIDGNRIYWGYLSILERMIVPPLSIYFCKLPPNFSFVDDAFFDTLLDYPGDYVEVKRDAKSKFSEVV